MSSVQETLRNEPVFVTGGSGFIGAHLCRQLVAYGAEVHALSRESREEGSEQVRWWQGDLRDRERVHEVISHIRPTIIFHLASRVAGARDRSLVLPMLRANLMSTIHLLDAASEVACQRIVLCGSLEEPKEGGTIPPSPYAAAKWSSSIYARMYYALYGTPTVTLRLGMVYGPAQMDFQKLVPYVITSLLRGESPELSSGDRRVDWVYVDDVVDGLVRGATVSGIEGETIDIGSGRRHSIHEVVEEVEKRIDTETEPIYGARSDRLHEPEFVADTSRTFTLLEWKAQTSLSDGLHRTVDWYRTFLVSSEDEGIE